jgi:hypothetical protein
MFPEIAILVQQHHLLRDAKPNPLSVDLKHITIVLYEFQTKLVRPKAALNADIVRVALRLKDVGEWNISSLSHSLCLAYRFFNLIAFADDRRSAINGLRISAGSIDDNLHKYSSCCPCRSPNKLIVA